MEVNLVIQVILHLNKVTLRIITKQNKIQQITQSYLPKFILKEEIDKTFKSRIC